MHRAPTPQTDQKPASIITHAPNAVYLPQQPLDLTWLVRQTKQLKDIALILPDLRQAKQLFQEITLKLGELFALRDRGIDLIVRAIDEIDIFGAGIRRAKQDAAQTRKLIEQPSS